MQTDLAAIAGPAMVELLLSGTALVIALFISYGIAKAFFRVLGFTTNLFRSHRK